MENFEVQVEELGNLKRKLTVTVPKESVKGAYAKCYSGIKSKVKVNGFRNGKMPQSLLEKRFQKYMAEEAMETLVPEYYDKAIKQENIFPAMQPEIGEMTVDKKKPFVFSATIEIWPNFDLPAYSDLKLDQVEVEIADDELEKQKKTHLERYATTEPKDGAAEEGDHLDISFIGKIADGEEVKQDNYVYVLGSKQFLPEFETALLGMSKGESKNFDAALPGDHPEEGLRDKSANFDVTLNEVMSQKLPAVDSALLDEHYKGRAANEEEFDELLKKEVTELKTYQQKVDYRAALKENLAEVLTFDLPETPLKDEINFRKQQAENGPDKDLAENELEEKIAKEANNHLRVSRYLAKVQEDENIEVNQDEVYNRFNMNANMIGMNPMELIKSNEGKQFYQETHQIIMEEAVLDFITQKVLS